MNKNIVLIGFMGSGKTSIGKKLASILKSEFIDTDDFIVKKEGMSINDIFATKGEPYFRQLEQDLCTKFSKPKNKIIATGGGIIKNSLNVENLKKGGTIFYLKSTPARIAQNLKYDNSRPLLKGPNKEKIIAKLMAERKDLYESCADITIDVSKMDIDQSVKNILNIINN